MKMYRFWIAVMCFAAVLSGCGKKEVPAVTTVPEATQPPAAAQPRLTEEELEKKRLRAYCQTVENFAYEQRLPDGRQAQLDSGFGAMEGNYFALYDVDGDGTEELVLSFSTCPAAEMALFVCGYDGLAGAVTQELTEFPAVTFYPGGVAVAEASHNQGMAGEGLWPYTVYTYDPEKGAYRLAAAVDGWDKSLGDTGFSGEPFPENVDLDKDGYVYCVSRDGVTRYLDGEDYESWRSSQGITGEPLPVEYLAVTRENIQAAFGG